MRHKTAFQKNLIAECILHLRSRRADSRSSLSRAMGISPSSAGQHVDQLTAKGFVTESGYGIGKIGRPHRLIHLHPEAGWFAGIEFHAQRVRAVSVDFTGKVITRQYRPLPENPGMADVRQAVGGVLAELTTEVGTPLLAVGLGVPGIVNSQARLALRYSFIRDWKNIRVEDILHVPAGVPVMLDQNLRAIALAERFYGLQARLKNYVVLGARSGFGAAIVQDGQLSAGSRHSAGEIGLWPWPLHGANGSTQELHHALSAVSTWRRLSGAAETATPPDDLEEAFSKLAAAPARLRKEVAADYGRVIGCMQLMLDPEVFIIHGPLIHLGMEFFRDITASAERMMPILRSVPMRIEPTELGDEAGPLGAACLAMENWQP